MRKLIWLPLTIAIAASLGACGKAAVSENVTAENILVPDESADENLAAPENAVVGDDASNGFGNVQ